MNKSWCRCCSLVHLLLVLLIPTQFGAALFFPPVTKHYRSFRPLLAAETGGTPDVSTARLVGYVPGGQQEEDLKALLRKVGFDRVETNKDDDTDDDDEKSVFCYQYVKASGMLKLVSSSLSDGNTGAVAPRYVPVQSGEEKVLVDNGWSFLDPDTAEPLSAFDVDAANEEGQYRPSWGRTTAPDDDTILPRSDLGYDLTPLSSDAVLAAAAALRDDTNTAAVLLRGATDPPHVKVTHNGVDLSGSFRKDAVHGVFTCAIGRAPLFTTDDLSPLTGSSGWLTFVRPVSDDHVRILTPHKDASDQRREVVDATSGCHLGHFFGSDGYCINASALNLVSSVTPDDATTTHLLAGPSSWRTPSFWDQQEQQRLTRAQVTLATALRRQQPTTTFLLGAGCFWHVEHAVRRLPGVRDTAVGYAGGTSPHPTYEDVGRGDTGHAEVVRLTLDATADLARILDCCLALHDPTMTRAHGTRARKTGRYRSCLLWEHDDDNDGTIARAARNAVERCRTQLQKTELSTEVRDVETCWPAEDRHQRHDERVGRRSEGSTTEALDTLSFDAWLREYGRRADTIWGSGETVVVADDDFADDGMARMMI